MENEPKGPYFDFAKKLYRDDCTNENDPLRDEKYWTGYDWGIVRAIEKACVMGRASRNGLREALDLFKPLIEEDRFGMISDEYRKAIEAFDKAMAADDEAGK